MKTHVVEGILGGQSHVALSIDGVCDKQVAVNCMTSDAIKWSLNKEKNKVSSEWHNIP